MSLFKNQTRIAMAYTNKVGDKIYPVVVDIKKGIKSTEDIQFVSSDVNTGILSVAFIQGNDNYNVTGADVVCSVMRPDASTLELPCEVVRENIVEVPLGINGTSQDGVYSFDFKVLKGGNKVVGTPIMNYSVSLSIGNDMVVEEDDRLPVLTMLMTQVTELKDETREAINQANTATVASREATANAIEATANANAVSERVSQETATAISEIKQDTENAIDSINQSTSTAISTMNQSTNDAIGSMTQKTNEAVTRVNDNLTNINNTVATKVAELDTAKSDMTTSINNKIQEVETRFNTLTSAQQQSSEVIDARDGETSLKARLDRDIEKANKELDKIKKLEESTVSTVTTESDFTTVEATSNGYFEDVKLEGRTLVNLFDKSNIAPTNMVVSGCSFSRQLTPIKSYGYLQIPLDKLSLFKSNGRYKVIVNITKNTLVEEGGSQKAFELPSYNYGNTAIESSTNGNYSVQFSIGEVGTKECIITMKDFDNPSNPMALSVLRFSSSFYAVSGELEGQILILECKDDLPQDVNFFEGLKSVGQNVDEVSVESVNKNLFNGVTSGTDRRISTSNGYMYEQPGYSVTDYIKIKPSTGYVVSTGETYYCSFYDKDKKYISGGGYNSGITSPQNAQYIRFDFKTVNINIVQIEKGVVATQYTPHQSDKKHLLFYNNETQTWEKPILREWDSIEKHANGKYYYHQRSGEVVLNGSEDWRLYSQEDNGCYSAALTLTNSANYIGLNVVCDKFNSLNTYSTLYYGRGIGIYVGTRNMSSGNVIIGFKNEDLPSRDIVGFKTKLQTLAPIKVVYKLAQEKVYECTNIDLITCEGETNYIVESGAIVPRTTLKVHNNISNVVNILQEKVSLLEDKFIQGLKQVLAGDMYSLAELLYPEDFVEENPENEIMLIPFE